MEKNIPKQKDAFTVRMKPELYDKMQERIRSLGRKGKSINKYINGLIEKDIFGGKNK